VRWHSLRSTLTILTDPLAFHRTKSNESHSRGRVSCRRPSTPMGGNQKGQFQIQRKIYFIPFVNRCHWFIVLHATRPSKTYFEISYIHTMRLYTAHYMFRPTLVIIGCLKLIVEIAVLPFCDTNILWVVFHGTGWLLLLCSVSRLHLMKTNVGRNMYCNVQQTNKQTNKQNPWP
jgi:hypothetical protein